MSLRNILMITLGAALIGCAKPPQPSQDTAASEAKTSSAVDPSPSSSSTAAPASVGRTTNYDDIEFGDALCRKHYFPREIGIVEAKVNNRYQVRIQEAGLSKLEVGGVYWVNRGEWLLCDDEKLDILER